MKKIVFLFLSLYIVPSFGYEDIPILPQNSGVNIQFVENNDNLIDYKGMKKADKIKEAETKRNLNSTPKLKIDSKQINYQRALDYTTNQNNYILLPKF